MSWLISLVVAGLMLTSDGANTAAVSSNNNLTDTKSKIERSNRFEETERFSQTYPFSANGRVSVSNVNGSITIETWDRNEVKLDYVKTAEDRERLVAFRVEIDAKPDSFRVETDYDQNSSYNGRNGWKNNGKSEVQYTLTVPRNAVLNEIETVNGSVSIANAANSTKASSVNGQVRAINLRGAADLSTVNGTVEADFDQLQKGSRISLNTVNGQANLTIPSDANATVKADTVNGSIANDFSLPVRKGQYVGKDLYGRIGSGDVQIRLNSVNGALTVKRKNDGKNVNPATNLLTTKSDEDWDDDADSDSAVRSPKPPRTPRTPRPPRAPQNVIIDQNQINKEIEEGLKQAQKEMENIQPELDKIQAEELKKAFAVNKEEMQARVKEAQERYKESFARMADFNWTLGSPLIEEKSESFTVKDTPKVTVEAGNCAVSVRGWDKSEVRYSVTRFSRQRGQSPLNLQATQSNSDVYIKFAGENGANNQNEKDKTFGKFFFNDTNRVRIEIFVPKKSNLKIVTGGEIRLENVSGEVDLQGADEAINVRDAGGKLTAATADGKIRIIGFDGSIDTKTDGGAINLEGDFRGLSARTADGTIILTLPENANANIESNRKDVTGEGFSLINQNDAKGNSMWKIGKGGENYQLYANDTGRIIVRSNKQLQN